MHINYESHEQKAVRKKYITLNAHVFVNREQSRGTIIGEDHRARRELAFMCFDSNPKSTHSRNPNSTIRH